MGALSGFEPDVFKWLCLADVFDAESSDGASSRCTRRSCFWASFRSGLLLTGEDVASLAISRSLACSAAVLRPPDMLSFELLLACWSHWFSEDTCEDVDDFDRIDEVLADRVVRLLFSRVSSCCVRMYSTVATD